MPSKTPKESLRKELTTCQNLQCQKSRLDKGVTLSKCAGCKIALYCSKACQKAAWRDHKTTCKLNRRGEEARPSERSDILKRLRAFCSQHRPSLAHYGIHALDLPLDYTRSLREVVHIHVKEVQNATCTELSFNALHAEIVPLECFGPCLAEEFRGQLMDFTTQQKRIGRLGGIMVIVTEVETLATNICPVGFGDDVLTLEIGKPWKLPLLNNLNLGLVY